MTSAVRPWHREDQCPERAPGAPPMPTGSPADRHRCVRRTGHVARCAFGRPGVTRVAEVGQFELVTHLAPRSGSPWPLCEVIAGHWKTTVDPSGVTCSGCLALVLGGVLA